MEVNYGIKCILWYLKTTICFKNIHNISGAGGLTNRIISFINYNRKDKLIDMIGWALLNLEFFIWMSCGMYYQVSFNSVSTGFFLTSFLTTAVVIQTVDLTTVDLATIDLQQLFSATVALISWRRGQMSRAGGKYPGNLYTQDSKFQIFLELCIQLIWDIYPLVDGQQSQSHLS